MGLIEGQKVRFTRDSRDGTFLKGQFGTVESLLAARPLATADIYLVKTDRMIWATHEDFEPWYQLSLLEG
jgi:hypothetical protein